MANSKKWFVIALLFAFITTCITFSSFIYSPWNNLPQISGDALKNVYVFLYHSIYGKGNWFEGMNYPYGEHIICNDALPIFSVFLAPLHLINTEQGFTIIWWTIAESYVIGIVYLYLILKEFSVYPILAILFACLIGVCSPQIPRINGHYSLSLCCIIPMIFYWTLKYLRTPKIKYPFFIFLMGCVVYFIHPYFNGMLMIWGLFFCIGYLIFYKQTMYMKIRFVAIYLTSIAASFILILFYIQFTDPLKDRPKIPYGTLEYYSHPKEILTSNISPIWLMLKKNGFIKEPAGFNEGYSYIGITALVIMTLYIILIFIRKIRNSNRTNLTIKAEVKLEEPNRIWIFLAIGVLLVGMGIPFMWNMGWLLKYLPGFSQFRALGRFSWMFYYLITVFSILVLNQWLEVLFKKRKFKLAYSIILLALSIWSWEAIGSIGFVWGLAKGGKNNFDWFVSKNQQSWEGFLNQYKYSKTDFQAIMLMKNINEGTEKLFIDPIQNSLISHAFRASFQLHLPITANYAGRTSLSVAVKQIKISDGPFTYKPILIDSKSNKPYLMLVYENEELNPDEKYLFQSSDYIGTFSSCKVYAFYPVRCQQNDAKWADSVKKILPFIHSDTCLGNNNVVIEHFDSNRAKENFFGKGAIAAIKKNDSEVGVFHLKPLMDSALFEFSVWVLITRDNFMSPDVLLEMCDSNNQQIGLVCSATKFSSDAEGLWFRNSNYFFVPPSCQSIKCKILNYEQSSYLVMDELQLRPVDVIIISKAFDGKVLVNNHLFKAL